MKQRFLIIVVFIVGIVLISGCIQQDIEEEKCWIIENNECVEPESFCPKSCAILENCYLTLNECKADLEKETLPESYLKENMFSCNIDSDCQVMFFGCPPGGLKSCSNVCINTYQEELIDCTLACMEEDRSVQSCECVSNECIPA